MLAEQRLLELGITLPIPSQPAGNYLQAVRTGALLYLSGKASKLPDGTSPMGRIGDQFDREEGYRTARLACLDLLAAIRAELGSLDMVEQVVEVHGSLCATPEFLHHAEVLDGASDLLVDVFGRAGMHARSVIGVTSLRNGVPLTIKAIVACR